MNSEHEAATRLIRGTPLACPVCRNTRFHSREYLLNTRAATFFNVDWTNRAATTFICERCGHILWFASDPDELT